MSNSNDRPNYYEILGVPTTASFEEIKQAFRQLASSYHPDRAVGESESVQKFALRKFKEINQAYEVLKDYYKRQDYDRELKASTADLKKQELIGQIQELYENKSLEEAVKIAKSLSEMFTDDLDCINIYAGLAYELAIELVENNQLDSAESYLELALSTSKNDDFKQQLQADLKLLKSQKDRDRQEKLSAAERERIEAERQRKSEKLRREEAQAERRRKSEEKLRREAAVIDWTLEEKPTVNPEIYRYLYGVFLPIFSQAFVVFAGALITICIIIFGFGIAVKNIMEIVGDIHYPILAGIVGSLLLLIGSAIYSINQRSFKPLLLLLGSLVFISFMGGTLFLTSSIISNILEVSPVHPLIRIAIGAILLLIGIIFSRR